MSTTSQNREILAHLKSGQTITAFEALKFFGSLRLAARIKDLRDSGYQIHTEMVDVGNDKRVAEYTLIKETTDE
jgi:hypothetical protein|tara:strand:+ start:12370 stop:12591 length:222 start_codon:yes stop_codon:yes gene_type:complete